jgi:hypothetical protein
VRGNQEKLEFLVSNVRADLPHSPGRRVNRRYLRFPAEDRSRLKRALPITTARPRKWGKRKPARSGPGCGLLLGRLLVQSDDPDHVLQACRIAGNASPDALLQTVGEYQPLPCVTRRRERLRQRRHEDRAEKPCALARERCRIPIPLKLDPLLGRAPSRCRNAQRRAHETVGRRQTAPANPAHAAGTRRSSCARARRQ